MNFNYNKSPEYGLIGMLSEEFINLYGIECRYYVVERILKDEVLGEHHRIKYDKRKGHHLTILPSNTENFDGSNIFGPMGFQNNESLVGFISSKSMQKIHPKIFKKEGDNYDDIIGNIVIFESGKIMEVASISAYSEGTLNNLYVYNNEKNIYKITLRTHIGSADDSIDLKKEDLDPTIKQDYSQIEELEKIFELDVSQKEKQEEKKMKMTRDPVKQKEADTNYNSVFGNLG